MPRQRCPPPFPPTPVPGLGAPRGPPISAVRQHRRSRPRRPGGKVPPRGSSTPSPCTPHPVQRSLAIRGCERLISCLHADASWLRLPGVLDLHTEHVLR